MGGNEKSFFSLIELVRAVKGVLLFGREVDSDLLQNVTDCSENVTARSENAANSKCAAFAGEGCVDVAALQKLASSFFVSSVATDSRNVKKGSLFVPLIGENQDGHIYIEDALKAGAASVFVTKSVFDFDRKKFEALSKKNPCAAFVIVENNLLALQNAARSYCKKFPSLVKIAITGSSGKTSTKEILSSILRQKFSVVSTKGNLNSETGLPLSVFEIREEHEVCVFEMGMNRPGEIAEIARVLEAQFAIVTNIGEAHIGILKSKKNIAAEKKNVFSYIKEGGAAFVPEGEFADFLSRGVLGKVVRFGRGLEKKFGVEFLEDCGAGGTRFSICGIETRLKMPGLYNFENALSCVALAKELGLSEKEIALGIESVCALEGRGEIEEVFCGKKNLFFMKDFYNANPESMKRSLEFFFGLKTKGKKFFVLGDMKELGERSKKCHEDMGLFCAALCEKKCAESSDAAASVAGFAGGGMATSAASSLPHSKADGASPQGQAGGEKKCGGDCAADFSDGASAFAKKDFSSAFFLFVGSDMNFAFCAAKKSGLKNAVLFLENDSEKIAAFILQNALPGDFVFLKASRSMEFEKIFFALQKGEQKGAA